MKKTEKKKRVLGRRLARELTPAELAAVSGGTVSLCDGHPSDADHEFQN
jgi:hypothetical protein